MQNAHPEIPTGTYCYSRVDGKFKACPHWHGTENGARCDLLNEEHHTYCPFHLVWDQVKECGINKGEDDESDGESIEKPKGTARTVTCPCNRPVEIINVKGDSDKLENVFKELREN